MDYAEQMIHIYNHLCQSTFIKVSLVNNILDHKCTPIESGEGMGKCSV